jgi:hypothetical protein
MVAAHLWSADGGNGRLGTSFVVEVAIEGTLALAHLAIDAIPEH